MMRLQNIFLIGPMGAGKSTVGRQLAESLGYEFRDSDREIQRRTGVDIPTIFEFEGEEGFRQRESRLLDELSAKSGVLIATGGGVVCFEENRRILRSRGVVVYLKTSVEQQLLRLSKDKSRPLLQAEDRMQRLQELARVRNPLYAETADLVFNSRKSNIYASAKAIAEAISEQVNSINPHTETGNANSQS